MVNIKKTELAELICIILGDGHIHRIGEKNYSNSEIRVSLDRVKDEQYVDYVRDLLIKIFGFKPKEHHRKRCNGIDLKVLGTEYVDFLIDKGLVTGNKTENQVYVPNWIKSNKNYAIKGLKGLFDTDGSVYVANRNKTINLNFRNASKPLTEDFREMCLFLGIQVRKVGYNISRKNNKETKGYHVQIQSRVNVKKFLEDIQPEKWSNHKKEISEKLTKLGTSVEEAMIDSRKKQNY